MIAIIAILASMLLPALNKARDRAKAVNCVNRMKQYGMCYLNYAGDYNDYVLVYERNDGKKKMYWYTDGSPVATGMGKVKYWESCPGQPLFAKSTDTPSRNRGYVACDSYGTVKIGKVKNPSAKWLMMDNNDTADYCYQWNNKVENYVKLIGYRHSSGANVLYFDGHVGWKTRSWILEAINNPKTVPFHYVAD